MQRSFSDGSRRNPVRRQNSHFTYARKRAMVEGRTRTIALAVALFLPLPGFAQNPTFFTQGNLVVTVEGCGVNAGTCTNVPNGTGNGAGNSSNTGYGDNQAAPVTLFQYAPNGTSSATFVNSLVLPQTASGANVAVSGEYGSSSEGTLQLAGRGQYLTLMGYGVNADTFNATPATYSLAGSGNTALAQSGSLTGQSYTPVPRVVTLIDASGNVNSSTVLYNIFNANNPQSTYSLDGINIYVSGQGTKGDNTSGVFYTTVGSGSTTSITGNDAGTGESQDTRTVQIYHNTLGVSSDSKSGATNRDYIGALGTPPPTSVYKNASGPTMLRGFGNAGGTGKETITTGANGNGNGLNAGLQINLSPENYFFASPTVLYVADTGSPKNDSATSLIGDGGLQKWIFSGGRWSLAYTLYLGLNLVENSTTNPNNTTGTTGLYGLTGTVSGNTVMLYATNYTIADLDPTFLYGITDNLSYATASQASSETFTELAAAPLDSNFKGVSFAPIIPAGDVEVTTVPSGLTVTTSGTGCAPGTFTAPQTLAWTPESSCTLSVVSPQSGAPGVQNVLEQWQDGTTGTSDIVTAPATTATYTASFTTEYQLTTTAETGGSVSPGGFFAAGTSATVTATPNAGYYFVNFTGTTTSTSNPLSLTVNSPQSIAANFAAQASQAITFTTGPPQSAAYGSSFTVAATGGGSGNPVVFTSAGGCTNSGTIYTMTSASTVCSVIANQAGNTDYLAAPQVSYSVSAALAATSINVMSVNPPSEDYGLDATVTITAVLSWSGSGTAPTAANVTIGGNGPSSYGTTNCAAPSGNTITCTNTYTPTTADTPDFYTETAAFSGDSNYSSSSSPQTNNFTINIASSTTTVSSSVNPSAYGQSVIFTATINGENGDITRRTPRGVRKGRGIRPEIAGSVTWSSNTGCGTTAATSGNPGVATCTASTLPVSTNTITATYSGDSNHHGSSGTLSGGQVVNQAGTSINVTSVSPSGEAYGQDVTVTITAVLSWGGSATMPTAANVSIGGNGPSSYGTTSCAAPSGNTITCTNTYTPTSADTPGYYTETAAFSGDSNYASSSSSQTDNFTVNSATSTTTVTSNLNPSTYGQSVTFTATINGEYGDLKHLARRGLAKQQNIGGTVMWSSNTGCGTTPVSGNPGIATCTTPSLQGGNDTIVATYSGDSNHNGSAGSLSGGQVVNPATQTITFTTNAPSSAVYNTQFTVAATASSGLPVTFTSAGVCSSSGASYTMTSRAGTCTVIANQAGNANYSAAPPVTEFTTAQPANQIAVTTYHYDTLRSGWNQSETQLTPANVGTSSFNRLHSVTLDAQVDAQPLIVPNELITAGSYQGPHDVVYVASEGNTVFAIDANNGTVLLSSNFGAPIPTPNGCPTNPVVGINSTPVLDTAANMMYVMIYTMGTDGPVYQLHGLNLGSLTDAITPAVVSASVMLTNGSIFDFNATYQRQRPALLLANGNIYAAFGSFCDFDVSQSRGWLMGWQEGTLTPLAGEQVFDTQATSPDNFFLSSIWMSGWGIAADSSGNLYMVTGNSDKSGTTYDGVTDIQESAIKVSGDLTEVLSLFTPSDWSTLDQGDIDFGSGGIMLLPTTSGSPAWNLAVAAGKDGNMFLMNQNDLGGYNPAGNNVLGTYPIGTCFCGASYYVDPSDGNPRVVSSGGNTLQIFELRTTPTVTLTNVASSVALFSHNHGFFTTVSSNGTQSPIIWALGRQTFKTSELTLYAFNPEAGGGAVTPIFTSHSPGTWPYNGNANLIPVVANGKVYVASGQELTIFGFLHPQILSFTPASGPVGTQVTITGTALATTTELGFGNDVPAQFTVNSNTQVTATVPSGAKTGKINLDAPGGIALSSIVFTVTN
jgi:hypothetical protein